ncbi:MAG TPA: signal peptidase I [Armatimonadota bacterium]|jgi:signal peptidase I
MNVDWLANISIQYIIIAAIALAVVRIGIARSEALPRSLAASAGEFVEALLFALVLVFLVIRPFIVQAFYIPSESMVPNLLVGDRILVNKFVYRFREPQRGDVVVFKAPPRAAEDEKDFIKRLVALPGDTVAVHDGKLFVNDKPFPDWMLPRARDPFASPEQMEAQRADPSRPAEPMDYVFPEPGKNYTHSDPQFPFDIASGKPMTVPPGYLFVMGDNRNNSRDSHFWGPLERDRVLGKAMLIFWPPNRMRILR